MKNKKSKNEPKVDWSIFDSIWCITFTGYPERRKAVESELKRVGILDSGRFNWRFTFPTIFDNILFDVTKKRLKKNECRSVSSMSCALGHYGCIKTAYELGHEFTLVMEDDIRFLNDVGKISDVLKDIPPCSDVVNFDVLPSSKEWNPKSFKEFVNANSYNEHFFKYNSLWGGSFYALSRNAMKAICTRYEQVLFPSDSYISGFINLGKEISFYASSPNICCQVAYSNSVNSSLFGNGALHIPYSIIGLDYSEYNIFDKEGYGYGSSI